MPNSIRFTLILSTLCLTGCLESQKDCHDRLAADFEGYAYWAISEANKKTGKEKERYLADGVIATQSAVRILQIWLDNDMDACDYFSDGPKIRKK